MKLIRHAWQSRMMLTAVGAALLLVACGISHLARFIYARNDTGHETLVRMSEGGIVHVYRLPTGFNGFVAWVSEPYRPTVEILDSSCRLLGLAPAMEGTGGRLLQIGPEFAIAVSETVVPQGSDRPSAAELFGGMCGSTQAGPGG